MVPDGRCLVGGAWWEVPDGWCLVEVYVCSALWEAPFSWCPFLILVSDQPNRVADHSPEDIGLRLTADGYLTADICMDLPPIRTVLLDPYTG